MATRSKVGVYPRWYGPVPQGPDGKPLPRKKWAEHRRRKWVVRTPTQDGARLSRTFETRKEAERYARKVEEKGTAQRVVKTPKITLGAYIVEHQRATQGQVADSTLKLQVDALKRFSAFVGDGVPLDRVTARMAERFLSARLSKGLSKATVNRDLRDLRRVFNLAISPRGYLEPGQNPFAGIKQLKVAEKTLRCVTADEHRKIIEACPDVWWRAFITTIYTTGLRLREATNLTWADVDVEGRRVRVGRKDASGYIQAWRPKDHERRVVPLPEQAVALLGMLFEAAAEGCPYVFVTPDRWAFYKAECDAGRWRPGRDLLNNLLRRFQTIVKRAGVDRATLHDLRRSCITNWARELPIHVVQKLAGHSDIKTTQRHYLVVEQRDFDEARRVQERLVGIQNQKVVDPVWTPPAQKRCFPAPRREEPKT